MLRFCVLLVALFLSIAVANAGRLPFLSRQKKYTPLLFYKMPHGTSPESDELERVVSEVEKELGVTVERLDVMRDPMVQKGYGMLSSRMPPLLYHRESRQIVSIPTSEQKASDAEDEEEEEGAKEKVPVVIDEDRIRAWAKGRYLPPPDVEKKLSATIVADEKAAMDQQEMLEDQALNPLQREGKENIRKRTEEKAEERKRRIR